jgi:hypothetical protein
MILKFFSAVATAALIALPVAAEQAVSKDCKAAGAGAVFCRGDNFKPLNYSQVEGISFWLHREGFLSKVLVEEISDEVTQARIESRIMKVVSQQAESIGTEFEFEDLASDMLDGAPFGTLSYSLMQKGSPKAVLHSYVATKGVVLQVISQIALKSADTAPAALEVAHAAALRAVRLGDRPEPSETDA